MDSEGAKELQPPLIFIPGSASEEVRRRKDKEELKESNMRKMGKII